MENCTVTLDVRSVQRMTLKSNKPYGSTIVLWFLQAPQALSFDSPEWRFIASIMMKGYDTSKKVSEHVLELSLENLIPTDVDSLMLRRWIYWLTFKTKIGTSLIDPTC